MEELLRHSDTLSLYEPDTAARMIVIKTRAVIEARYLPKLILRSF